MRTLTLVVASVVCMGLGPSGAARAEFMAVASREVPVARLLENLERQLGGEADKVLARDPTKAEVVFELARLHALAWATARPTATVRGQGEEPWFGELPPAVEYAHAKDAMAKRTPAIDAHLSEAIRLYRAGLAVAPSEARRLGLAWCLAQRGGDARAEAVKLLRAIGDLAWATEKDREAWGMGDYGLAWEAAGYLIDLLDPKADAAEIAALGLRRRQVEAQPRPITPIVVPLVDGAGLASVVDAAAGVQFDLDGSGVDKRCGWVVPGRGAWLVWDPTRSGVVTSGLSLFGSVSFWIFWPDGYAALAALDDDGDGALRGAELAGLALWQDDGDGVSELGEVIPVEGAGIVALGVRGARGDDGTPWAPDGVTFADGRTRATWDFITR